MNRSLYIIFVLCLAKTSFSQSVSFEKYFNHEQSFEITDLAEDDDNYFLLCNESVGTFDRHTSFLIKLNKEGDSILHKQIDIPFLFLLYDLLVNDDHEIAYVGAIDSSGTGTKINGLFVLLDLSGNLLSSRAYAPAVTSEFISLLQSDSGYYFSGHIYDDTTNGRDIFLAETDRTGEISNSKSIHFKSTDISASLNYFNNKILISGSVLMPSKFSHITLLNKNLDTLFSKHFNVFYDIKGQEISVLGLRTAKKTSDNKIISPGVFFTRNIIDTTDIETYERTGLIQTDSSGNFLSLDIFYLDCPDERVVDVFETNDGNYIIGGTFNFETWGLPTSKDGDFYLMKVDTAGNILWLKQYGNSNYQEMKSMIRTQDGGFMMVGYSYSHLTNKKSGYVVKTDADGNVAVGMADDKRSSNLKVYPNPANEYIEIEFQASNSSVVISNLLGNVLQTLPLSPNQTKHRISLSEIPNGLYILQIKSNGRSVSQHKVIVNN